MMSLAKLQGLQLSWSLKMDLLRALIPGNGAAKVVEEGTGTECLKCRYDGLIVMSVATEGRTRAEGPIEFFGLGLLLRQAIMESEDGDPLVVKVRQNDG